MEEQVIMDRFEKWCAIDNRQCDGDCKSRHKVLVKCPAYMVIKIENRG